MMAPRRLFGIDQILGMTSTLLDQLRPLVTVHSRLTGIDPTVASREVLQALGGNAPSQGLPQVLAVRSPARAFHVTVIATRGARRASRSATIELVPRAAHGFLVREWGSFAAADFAAPIGGVECGLL